MSELEYVVRPLSRTEMDLAIEWAAREGWNPGLADADIFYATDPQGFLGGFLDDRLIACVSAVDYTSESESESESEPGFGFAGFYIVDPQFRGQGYGLTLAQAAMARLGGRNIGLDGVVEQQANYAKSGFKLAWQNVRYCGTGPQSALVEAAAENNFTAVVLSEIPFSILSDFDRQYFPARREAFLQRWIAQPGGIALGILDGGDLAGYGVMRPCREGYKIGPLCAQTPAMAEVLLQALTANLDTETSFYLDIPEPNINARELVKHHQMQRVFETARMYSGEPPALPLHHIYGITTFELG